VLSAVSKQEIEKIREGVDKFPLTIERLDKGRVFDVEATLYGEMHTSHVRVCDTHMGLVLVKRDDEVLFERPPQAEIKKTDRAFLSVEKIFEYAGSVEIEEIKATLDRQIAYNTAIAEEGLKRDYGANVGKVILRSYQPEVAVKAKAYAAAASDARMNGCELPVIINSGSGNQGITASLPVIVYARELQLPMEKLYRALAVSNLVTVHLKSGIGTLSAYCGVVSAGAGAACGIAYLLGGGMEEISHALVNALAIDSGIVCDGAKASCAAKIAMAVESGILGLNIHYNGCEFYAGDGIVKDGVEPTIRSVSRLAQDGMRETNAEILRIMMEEE
jgi:L-cysteine desulfidase